MSKHRPLLIVLGPTGVGKSRTAIRLAHSFSGEIINCDSMQVYRGFNIGTDKISPREREGIPHHLIDIIDPTVQFTAFDFLERAGRAAREISGRSRLPILTGGTGLYLTAFIRGIFPGGGKDPAARMRLETEAEQKGWEHLYQRLEAVDPEYAQKTGHRDRIRLIRALEVYETTGKTISEMFSSTRSPSRDFFILQIGLKCDRSLLYRKIEDRVDRMFESGLVQEVKDLLAEGIPPKAPPFRALGYQQVLKFVSGQMSLEETISETKKKTRQYAKRQMTWFRKMDNIHWFDPQDFEPLHSFIALNLFSPSNADD